MLLKILKYLTKVSLLLLLLIICESILSITMPEIIDYTSYGTLGITTHICFLLIIVYISCLKWSN